MSRTRIPLLRLAVLAAALLFSTGGAAIKATALTSFQVASGRSGVAALVLYLLAPRWRAFLRARPLLVGVAYGATMVLFVTSNKLTTSANAIFLQASAPIYVLGLAPLLLGERNRRSDFALTAILLAGIALFFIGVELPLRTAPDPAFGNAVALASGFTWACTLVGLRWLGRDPRGRHADEMGAAVIAGNTIACAACLPMAFPLGPVSPQDAALVVYLGVFQIGVAYLLLTRGVGGLPAVEVSLLLLLEPVLNTVWAWLIHGEQPGAWSLAGCTVIGAATLLRLLLPEGGGWRARPTARRGRPDRSGA